MKKGEKSVSSESRHLDQRLRQLFGNQAYSEGPLAASGAGRRLLELDMCKPLTSEQVSFLLDALSEFRIICLSGQDLNRFSLAHFERFAPHQQNILHTSFEARLRRGHQKEEHAGLLELFGSPLRNDVLLAIQGR